VSVKSVHQMSNDHLLLHLNRRHMPMATMRPPGSELTFVPNMTDSLAKVWKAWHDRVHAAEQLDHEHV